MPQKGALAKGKTNYRIDVKKWRVEVQLKNKIFRMISDPTGVQQARDQKPAINWKKSGGVRMAWKEVLDRIASAGA